MAQTVHSTIEARRDQMFPVLESAEIKRLARFGERKSYPEGARIFTTGEVAPGAFIILAGRAESSQHRLDRSEPIVTHGTGSFMGELAQLSGRPFGELLVGFGRLPPGPPPRQQLGGLGPRHQDLGPGHDGLARVKR